MPDFLPNFDAQAGRGAPADPVVPSQRESDEAELHAGLNKVAGIVAGARGVIDILRDVAEFAVRAIPGVDGAGVALIDGRQGIHSVQTWAATEVLVHDIDAVQYDELKEGPCISCMESGRAAGRVRRRSHAVRRPRRTVGISVRQHRGGRGVQRAVADQRP